MEGRATTATVLFESDGWDVAVLAGPPTTEALSLRSDQAQLGEQLTAYGYPAGTGAAADVRPVEVRETIRTRSGASLVPDYLPAGFNGGPVVDSCGEVVGLVYGNADIEGFRISAAVAARPCGPNLE